MTAAYHQPPPTWPPKPPPRLRQLVEIELEPLATTHLIMILISILENHPPAEFLQASREERAAFWLRLGAEIDARIPARAAVITSKPEDAATTDGPIPGG